MVTVTVALSAASGLPVTVHYATGGGTADPAQVTSGGRAVPVVDGAQGGFKLYAIRPGSAYAALGLEDGDVVRAINGTPVASADQILELVARSTGQITLDLFRRGQPLLLNYLIK